MPKIIDFESYRSLLIDRHVNNGEYISDIAKSINMDPHKLQRICRKLNLPIARYRGKVHNLKNQIFVFLKAIDYYGVIDQKSIWICECVCGKKVNRSAYGLLTGNITSCGCKGKGYNDIIPGYFYSGIKARARIRELDWQIDYKYLCDLFKEQNKVCAISNLPINFSDTKKEFECVRSTTASLDRIISSIGYVEGNVWWVHKDVNQSKLDLGLNTYINFCNFIANFDSNIIVENFKIEKDYLPCIKYKLYSQKNNRKRKNINKFTLCEHDIIYQIEKQGGRCNLSGLYLSFPTDYEKYRTSECNWSIDRINSNLGYISNNIQIILKDINKMKWNFTQEYFINLCKTVSNKGDIL